MTRLFPPERPEYPVCFPVCKTLCEFFHKVSLLRRQELLLSKSRQFDFPVNARFNASASCISVNGLSSNSTTFIDLNSRGLSVFDPSACDNHRHIRQHPPQ